MLLIQCDQGTDEWARARLGIITASMFCEVRKRMKSGPNKGGFSEAAKNYAFRLACERIAGTQIGATFETAAMRRGRELEEICRRRHEQDIGEIVELAGFITTDDGVYGCSADSLIGEDGGAEYKAFYDPEKVRAILVENDWGDIMDQAQGCMWITDRKFWDLCLYFPALAPIDRDFTRLRVERDQSYIDAMVSDLNEFADLVQSCEDALINVKREAA